MNVNKGWWLSLAAGIALAAGSSLAGEAPSRQGVPASVTVYPVIIKTSAPVPASMGLRLAEVVGLLLERAGVSKVDIVEAPATLSSDWSAAAAGFARFVQTQNLATDYALLAQMAGTPGKAIDQINLVLVDRKGHVVHRAEAGAAEIAQAKPPVGEPLEACLYLVNQLGQSLQLADPLRADAPRGAVAQRWESNAGVPSPHEREAIGQRGDAFRQSLAKRESAGGTIEVYAVLQDNSIDPAGSKALADLLSQNTGLKAAAGSGEYKNTLAGDSNEQKVLWQAARQFQEFVRKNPPRADYALLAHYGIRAGSAQAATDTTAAFVHLIVCDRQGRWVLVEYRNSHHVQFQAIDPRTIESCHRLALQMLGG